MFVYDPEVVTLAGVRRLLARVGADHIDDLIKVREADRIGSGVPKAQPYRLRYLLAMLEKVKTDPISAKMLKINGNDIMKLLEVPPGPILGKIIAVLLEDVLADPEKNEKSWLLERAKDLSKLTEKKLEEMAGAAKKRAHEAQQNIDEEIKKKWSHCILLDNPRMSVANGFGRYGMGVALRQAMKRQSQQETVDA